MLKYAVVNPATGETIKEYPTATAAEIEAALASPVTAGQASPRPPQRPAGAVKVSPENVVRR